MIQWFLGLNRHLRIAIILAPFLGIFGFGLTDLWVAKDRPQAPDQHIQVHELELAGPGDCVPDVVVCRLSYTANNAVNVSLRAVPASAQGLIRLDITAAMHVRGLKLALVQEDREEKLMAQPTMKTDEWYVEFPRQLIKQPAFTIRIALAQTRRVYLAEFPARLNSYSSPY